MQSPSNWVVRPLDLTLATLFCYRRARGTNRPRYSKYRYKYKFINLSLSQVRLPLLNAKEPQLPARSSAKGMDACAALSGFILQSLYLVGRVLCRAS